MLEYLGLNYTEEEVKHFLCGSVLIGFMSFSIILTTLDFFKEYKIKIMIVSRNPQN
jgi:hypothetical protein